MIGRGVRQKQEAGWLVVQAQRDARFQVGVDRLHVLASHGQTTPQELYMLQGLD